jgi:leader peptidase (prepilin peptidase)/N-methyltransferase
LTISIFTREDILAAIKDALILMGAFAALRYYVSYYISIKEERYIKNLLKSAPWLKVYVPKYITIEAMGEGDIIIAGILGALLGIKLSIVAIFLAALIALPASLIQKAIKGDNELPFIPFLALGGYLSLFFGEDILRYLGI